MSAYYSYYCLNKLLTKMSLLTKMTDIVFLFFHLKMHSHHTYSDMNGQKKFKQICSKCSI